MHLSLCLALISLFVCAAPVRAHLHLLTDEPQASVVLWHPDVRGSLGATVAGVAGGLTYADEGTTSLGATLALRTFGAVCLDFDYTPVETDSAVTARADFTFRNQLFGVTGQAGTLHYSMPIYGFGLRYIAYQGKYASVGVIGTVKVVNPQVQLTIGGQTAAFDMVLPVPMAGLSAQVNFSKWAHAFASVKIFHLDIAALNAKIDDWEAGLMFDRNPAHALGFRAAAGYRKLDIDIASGGGEDIRFSTRRGGPFAELALVF